MISRSPRYPIGSELFVFSAQISLTFSSNQLRFVGLVRFGFDAFGVAEEQLVLCLETCKTALRKFSVLGSDKSEILLN
jgi:hypothetical protein